MVAQEKVLRQTTETMQDLMTLQSLKAGKQDLHRLIQNGQQQMESSLHFQTRMKERKPDLSTRWPKVVTRILVTKTKQNGMTSRKETQNI